MKAANSTMLALIATGQFFLADCYTFTFKDGNVARYTSFDTDIVFGGHTWLSGKQTGPFFRREGDNSTIVWEVGLTVSTLEFTVIPGSGQVNGIDFSTAATIGYFDYADVVLERALMATPGDTTAGMIYLFNGIVGPISGGRSSGEIFTINAYTDLLNIQMPRNLIQPSCMNTLYDSGCGLVKASYGVAGTVLSGSTISSLRATLSQASDYFSLGSITYLTGANAGAIRAVQAYTNGSPSIAAVIPPLQNTPVAGDTFTIFPGCDKMQLTCLQKYDNLDNFRGAPGVPTPETAV